MTTLEVRILGDLTLSLNDTDIPVPAPKARAIAAQLALADGKVVATDDLIDGTWGDYPPASARNTLQYHVSVLRKSLAAAAAQKALLTRDHGYALVCTTDAIRFARLMRDGYADQEAGRTELAAANLTAALAEWRGPALADLRQFSFASRRAITLENQRLTCQEAWADAELAAGRAEAIVNPLTDLVAHNPTRERLWEQLMIALYRTGRQDAALAAYTDARAALGEHLGIDPSNRLRDVHRAILRHDRALSPHSPTLAHLVTTTRPLAATVVDEPSLVGPARMITALPQRAITIGRDVDCDLIILDSRASRHHARVVDRTEGFVITDLDSTNGTFINGVLLTAEHVLSDGDAILVGNTTVRFAVPRTGTLAK